MLRKLVAASPHGKLRFARRWVDTDDESCPNSIDSRSGIFSLRYDALRGKSTRLELSAYLPTYTSLTKERTNGCEEWYSTSGRNVGTAQFINSRLYCFRQKQISAGTSEFWFVNKSLSFPGRVIPAHSKFPRTRCARACRRLYKSFSYPSSRLCAIIVICIFVTMQSCKRRMQLFCAKSYGN